MRNSFIFKKEYALAFNGLDDSDRLKMYDALVAYAFSDKEPEEKLLVSMLNLIKPQLDSNLSSYDNYNARRSSEYRKWKEAVLRRDQHRCQECGNTESLQVHHIISFSECEELRYEISNGITLCASCHKGVHKNET